MNLIIPHLLEKTSFPDLNPPKRPLGTSKSNAAQTKLITFHPNLFVLTCILTWTTAAPSTQSKLWRHPRPYTLWVLWLPCESPSPVRLFATPWIVARQAPLSMEFSRQEQWSGLPFLLQEIFLTQGSNPGLLHCRKIPYHLSHQGHFNHITYSSYRHRK